MAACGSTISRTPQVSPGGTGPRSTVTIPVYVPNKDGWATDWFSVAAMPHSLSVWLFGSYGTNQAECRTKGIIADLR